jgi:hypothetical protein
VGSDVAAPSSSSVDPLPTIQHLHGGRLRTQQGEEAARTGASSCLGRGRSGLAHVGAGWLPPPSLAGWLAASPAAGKQIGEWRKGERREGLRFSDIRDQGCI